MQKLSSRMQCSCTTKLLGVMADDGHDDRDDECGSVGGGFSVKVEVFNLICFEPSDEEVREPDRLKD